MRRSVRAPTGLLLAITLALSACGSGDPGDVATGESADGSVSMGEFTDSKTELGALFERLQGARAVRIVQRAVAEGHEPGERDVFDVHFAPLTWRDRTYLGDKLDHEGIRQGNDLLDISYHKVNCPGARYKGWFVYPNFSDVPTDERNLQLQLAPGHLPHVLYELQYATFDGRAAEAGGYVLSGKVLPNETGLGWGYEPPNPKVRPDVPIRLRLDRTGLPLELTVDYTGSARPSNSFAAIFSYDDVKQVPTISDPRVFDGTLDIADLCKNWE